VNTILIAYDLDGPETSADYENLIAAIKAHTKWAKPEYSLFLIQTTKSASEVRDELKAHINSNDRLLVITVTDDDWACYGLPSKVTTWMKDNL
jgi:hypothetical protein